MMSACESPIWGRTDGTFSTLTASAGRFGTDPFLDSPVRGHRTGGGAPLPCPTPPSSAKPKGALPPSNRNAPTAPPMSTTAVVIQMIRPRRDNAMEGVFLLLMIRG